jgi:membrane-bound lytic murein transglycosylase A
MSLSAAFQPIAFHDLPGWDADDHSGALAAFARSAKAAAEKPYRTGALGVEHAAFSDAFAEACTEPAGDRQAARAFFERHFTPCLVQPAPAASGLVTGFYEPVAEASPYRTAEFQFPLYARPPDLVEVTDANRPAVLDPYHAFARATEAGLAEYHDRQAIERGALAGRDLEIAWLADPVDVFFIHVQGAARLRFPDGSIRRVTYAAKSGHRFTGPGHILVALGEIAREDVTMQAIRAWFRRNPNRTEEILWQNRSFIFFREAPVEDEGLGPVAAAKVPLTPGRSIAIDRHLHTFGTPFFIDASSLNAFGDAGGFRRLMIAQDTGSAIVGASRGDLFAGSGDAAGEIAGVVRHPADFYALIPNVLLGSHP